ncbi:MAG: C40 family peptidase [Firmicutes bacterium]|nr:C40 family peptidase [Bacillota bacterium]
MQEYRVMVSTADVWSQPGPGPDRERLTQALCGDRVRTKRVEKGWVLGQVQDGYWGWLARAELEPAPEKEERQVVVAEAVVQVPLLFSGGTATESPIRLYLGTRLTVIDEHPGSFVVRLPGGSLGQLPAGVVHRPTENKATEVLKYALCLKGSPYLWGGMTCDGIDCSGLVHMAYRTAGILLPRDADQQYAYGWRVESSLVPGDLVFFATTEPGFPAHVGHYLGEDRFLHASSRLGGVVVTSLNAPFYRECLLGARRVLTAQAGFGFRQGEEQGAWENTP